MVQQDREVGAAATVVEQDCAAAGPRVACGWRPGAPRHRRHLSPEITAFYGPNEAGKTTLMQFLRSVLYGMSAHRRKRYLPPFVGGKQFRPARLYSRNSA